jgi:hypothetical protein
VGGVGAWSFALAPPSVEGGELGVTLGTLTVHGVSKSNMGTTSQWEASKGRASDALKRAAGHLGSAR